MVRDLAIKIGQICANKPKKYSRNYSDELIKLSLEALRHAHTANSIFMTEHTNESDYLLRRHHLLELRGTIETIGDVAEIFLELVKKSDHDNSTKVTKQEQAIGDYCSEAHRKVNGVLKSDLKLYKQ